MQTTETARARVGLTRTWERCRDQRFVADARTQASRLEGLLSKTSLGLIAKARADPPAAALPVNSATLSGQPED